MKGLLLGPPTRSKLALQKASCESRVMACARLPGSTQLKKIQDAPWSSTKGSIAFAIAIDALLCLNPSVFLLLGIGECISPTAIPKGPFEET